MNRLLLIVFDHVSTELLGHSYRWLKWQREEIRRREQQERIKGRLVAAIVRRLREDLATSDSAGW